jgi:hypothetical protein
MNRRQFYFIISAVIILPIINLKIAVAKKLTRHAQTNININISYSKLDQILRSTNDTLFLIIKKYTDNEITTTVEQDRIIEDICQSIENWDYEEVNDHLSIPSYLLRLDVLCNIAYSSKIYQNYLKTR